MFVHRVSQLPPRNKQKREETRNKHGQSTLRSGDVLITGGCNDAGVTRKADIWTPSTGTWKKARPMKAARRGHTQSVLINGDVLVVGGNLEKAGPEVYSPKENRWTQLDIRLDNYFMTAQTTLRDGRVMVLGLENTGYVFDVTDPTSVAPVFCPAKVQAVVLVTLRDGRVFCVGSDGECFLFDVTTAKWTPTTRFPHRALNVGLQGSVLPSGKVVVLGGERGCIYDPKLEAWWQFNRAAGNVVHHGQSVLHDGSIVVTGGFNYYRNERMGGVTMILSGDWTPRTHNLWAVGRRRWITGLVMVMNRVGVAPDLIRMLIIESSSAS